jgi:hypothetical protein
VHQRPGNLLPEQIVACEQSHPSPRRTGSQPKIK